MDLLENLLKGAAVGDSACGGLPGDRAAPQRTLRVVGPLDVFAEVARVLQPGGVFVCTFSNRCFPTKAIRGWLANDDATRMRIVGAYFDFTEGFGEPTLQHRNPGARTDPLYAVWARRLG